uniref:Uncharacterized protein n=1 Tax=Tanacetum cinerariifolium TaxID=118510 RepID=A0A6L2NBC0_TANCI|nr:hypothetical protein [Tanacetum cinerariifolium]
MKLDSHEDDEPIIVQDEDEEVHAKKTLNSKLVKEKEVAKTKAALLKVQPSFPNVEKLTELLVTSLKPELLKLMTNHDFSASFPKEMKELPSKVDDIFRELKDLKKYVYELEIKLLGDLKENPTKLEEPNSIISSLTKQVAKLKNLKLEIQAGLLALPGQVSSITAQLSKLKTLDALLSLLNRVTKALDRQTGSMVESYKKKHLKKFDFSTEKGDHVYLTKEEIKEQKRIEELVKADMAKKEEKMEKEKLFDLLGIDLMTNVYKAKMNYDKYCDKMLNIRALARITNNDIISKGKGPITLMVYKEDGSIETIPKFKANDLHLVKWREVMHVCSKRTEAGWNTIFSNIQTRMENLHKTKQELEIDFTQPL